MKLLISIGIIIFSTAGGWVGADLFCHGNWFGIWSIVLSFIGAFVGVWAGYKTAQYLGI